MSNNTERSPDADYQALVNRHGEEYVAVTKEDITKWCKDTQSTIVDLEDFGYVELSRKLQAIRDEVAKINDSL